MSPEQKAKDMRSAIDAMELAMMDLPEMIELPQRWGEPRFGDHVIAHIYIPASKVYRICDALEELTRIINSDEYAV